MTIPDIGRMIDEQAAQIAHLTEMLKDLGQDLADLRNQLGVERPTLPPPIAVHPNIVSGVRR